MSKFTPGPWAYKRTHQMSEDTWYVITHHDGRGPVVDVGGKDENGQIAEAKYLITNPDEIEANARLIAAAPLMVAECQKQLDWLKHIKPQITAPESVMMGFDQAIKYLTDAIAKATKGDE